MWRSVTRLLVPPYRQKEPPSKMVAIVVPLSLRTDLTPEEQISMRHLLHYFGKYDKYLIAPKGLPVHFDGFKVKRFARKFFGSSIAHNRLTYARVFYRAFKDYKFIFFYHLDSLAFSDQLAEWCQTDLDYIGAPWLKCSDTPWVEETRVGNGGFTLLRVESALKVLHNRYRQEPSRFWVDFVDRNARVFEPIVRFARKLRLPAFLKPERIRSRWSQIEQPSRWGLNNDVFWADQAVKYLPEFKVASVRDGLRFAFEAAPRTCFEMNDRKLPFGCHAWARFDRSFWEPHLLKAEQIKNGQLN